MWVNAQSVKRPESYNYQRGLEAMQDEKRQEALEFFNKDLKENPKNGYSYSWIAMLRGQNEEYGRALTAADLAIKYLPKKDAEYVIFAYTTRAGVYLHLGCFSLGCPESAHLSAFRSPPLNRRAPGFRKRSRYFPASCTSSSRSARPGGAGNHAALSPRSRMYGTIV